MQEAVVIATILEDACRKYVYAVVEYAFDRKLFA